MTVHTVGSTDNVTMRAYSMTQMQSPVADVEVDQIIATPCGMADARGTLGYDSC